MVTLRTVQIGAKVKMANSCRYSKKLHIFTSLATRRARDHETPSIAVSNPSIAIVSDLHAQTLQIGRDKGFDVIQVFQIAALAAGHLGGVAPLCGLAGFCSSLYEPNLDDERMCVFLQQA